MTFFRVKSSKTKYLFTTLMLSTALSFSPQKAEAAGFFLQEQSTSGLGSAFAGEAAMPRNASILFFNPAGMTYLDGAQMNAGAHLIIPFANITNEGSELGGVPLTGSTSNPYDPAIVPNLHIAAPMFDDGRLWAGLSVTAPFGLGNKYDEDWFGRYDSIETDLMTINVQPSLAYQVTDRLSIGGGVDIQYADATLTQAQDFGLGIDGLAYFKGDDLSVGWNAGLMFDATDRLRLGAHYRSAISHDLSLTARITDPIGGIALEDTGASAALDLPDIASFAAAYEVNDQWTVMGHVMWFGWNNFEAITALSSAGTVITSIEQNYRNTRAYALGAEYVHDETWTFRGGLQYDETPTQDGFRSSRTPDGDRIWASLGATYNFSDAISIDLAATYIDVSGEDINVERDNTATGGDVAEINASAKQRIAIFALGVNYKF